MRHGGGKLGFAVFAALLVAMVPLAQADAWLQPAHEGLNEVAAHAFAESRGTWTTPSGTTVAFSSSTFTGEAVTNSGNLGITMGTTTETMDWQKWVVHGGSSADEPALYESFRHFYDPIALSGVTYLTDLLGDWTAGTHVKNPGIDAIAWALWHPDNPFSYADAFLYYKQAMEIPRGAAKEGILLASRDADREGPARTYTDEASLRSALLAKAFRALGETMHLLGDMTQPAHVRNDGHPRAEPIEDAVGNGMAFIAARKEALPGGPQLSPDGTPYDWMHALALFTNASFFSHETLFDAELGIMPINGENGWWDRNFYYASPQISQLPERRGAYLGWSLGDRFVPVVAETLSLNLLGTDAPISYLVPSTFAVSQAAVLLPYAREGAMLLADGLFPTLDLTMDPWIGSIDGTTFWDLDGRLVHSVAQDLRWLEQGLQILYSGPGSLVDGETGAVLAEVSFRSERIVEWRPAGAEEWFQGVPRVVLEPIEGPHLLLAAGTTLRYAVDAGGLVLQTAPVRFDRPLLIQPEELQTEPGSLFTLEAQINQWLPLGYELTWEMGDGSMPLVVPNATGMAWSYEIPDTYEILLTLKSWSSKESADAGQPADITVATASARVTVVRAPPTGAATSAPTAPPSQGGRAILGIWDGQITTLSEHVHRVYGYQNFDGEKIDDYDTANVGRTYQHDVTFGESERSDGTVRYYLLGPLFMPNYVPLGDKPDYTRMTFGSDGSFHVEAEGSFSGDVFSGSEHDEEYYTFVLDGRMTSETTWEATARITWKGRSKRTSSGGDLSTDVTGEYRIVGGLRTFE